MGQRVIKVAAVVSFSFSAMLSHAAEITLFGDTVNYVYDDTQIALSLFGTPSIHGDVVRFIPTNFRAESTNNSSGATITTANFVFDRVYSTNDKELMKIEVIEFGDYEITNGGQVGGDILLTASNNNDFLEFTSSSDSVDASGDSGGLQTWEMRTSINPATAFTVGTDVALSIQNTLTATTDELGEIAWIQKKLAFVATSEVPVPAAAWLFGSALLGLVGVARRKHS